MTCYTKKHYRFDNTLTILLTETGHLGGTIPIKANVINEAKTLFRSTL